MGHELVDEGIFNNINEAYDNGHALIGSLQAAYLLERGNDEDKELLSPAQLRSRNIRSSTQMLKIEFCKSLEVVSIENDGEGNSRNSQKWYLSSPEEVELWGLLELTEIVLRG
ncbi:hypothetical protein KSP39_PZI011986 [Platanthera zijinensis]|uniref:Uncharacterized protein n=1 Tax=Platanthera zijinensis TaxID=2320716 RepID=A0AAP0BGP9_9ASPA